MMFLFQTGDVQVFLAVNFPGCSMHHPSIIPPSQPSITNSPASGAKPVARKVTRSASKPNRSARASQNPNLSFGRNPVKNHLGCRKPILYIILQTIYYLLRCFKSIYKGNFRKNARCKVAKLRHTGLVESNFEWLPFMIAFLDKLRPRRS